MKIILALLIFSLIVLFHEFGHFLLAKRGGIGVTEFSLGMGPRLFSKQIGETRYSVKLLPFGGSCMMVGEDGESNEENSFGSKSVWTRISVVAAGPIYWPFSCRFLSSAASAMTRRTSWRSWTAIRQRRRACSRETGLCR